MKPCVNFNLIWEKLLYKIFFILHYKRRVFLLEIQIVSLHSFLNVPWRDLFDNYYCVLLSGYCFSFNQVSKIDPYLVSVVRVGNLLLSTVLFLRYSHLRQKNCYTVLFNVTNVQIVEHSTLIVVHDSVVCGIVTWQQVLLLPRPRSLNQSSALFNYHRAFMPIFTTNHVLHVFKVDI